VVLEANLLLEEKIIFPLTFIIYEDKNIVKIRCRIILRGERLINRRKE